MTGAAVPGFIANRSNLAHKESEHNVILKTSLYYCLLYCNEEAQYIINNISKICEARTINIFNNQIAEPNRVRDRLILFLDVDCGIFCTMFS